MSVEENEEELSWSEQAREAKVAGIDMSGLLFAQLRMLMRESDQSPEASAALAAGIADIRLAIKESLPDEMADWMTERAGTRRIAVDAVMDEVIDDWLRRHPA